MMKEGLGCIVILGKESLGKSLDETKLLNHEVFPSFEPIR